MGIFKAYDIRGLVPSELDADLARKIGHGFARLLGARRLVIGQDMRTHSPEIADAVTEGMRDAGSDVVRLGLASTPMAYWAIGSQECDGGLCVTASHNPGAVQRHEAVPRGRAAGLAATPASPTSRRMCAEPYPGAGAHRRRGRGVGRPPGRVRGPRRDLRPARTRDVVVADRRGQRHGRATRCPRSSQRRPARQDARRSSWSPTGPSRTTRRTRSRRRTSST